MLRVEHLGVTYLPPSGLLRFLVQTASREPVTALCDVSLAVDPGQVVGLVGPNGAGKSTLLRTCATLLTPTTGRVTIGGVDVETAPRAARSQVGLVLASDRAVYLRLTGRQNLRFFAAMEGLDPVRAEARTEELLEEFDLARRDRRTFGYSAGMIVRLGLARALLHEPPLLVLDEPSRSLDPVASDELVALVRRLADAGTAVLLSNHRLDEIEECCDDVVVLDEGRVRLSASMDELRSGGRRPAAVIREVLTTTEPG